MLLVVPICALHQLPTDWRLLAGISIAVSLATFFLYRTDKRRAQAGERRIPESTLHSMELVGGWPGAFLAQRKFRHKTAKRSYQITFWIIVLGHQVIALDFLLHWKLATHLFLFTTNQYLRLLG